MNELTLTIPLLEAAYDQGLFPMADSRKADANIVWYRPIKRAVLIPGLFHVPRRLARFMRQCPFEIRWNDDFAEVMLQCGQHRSEGSWINQPMIDAYTTWHRQGSAFCLSVFKEGIRVGGIYGIQRGGVFMAESMFSRMSNASSVALVILMAGLNKAGIEIIDLQYGNPHTARFNLITMTSRAYLKELERLKEKPVELKADYFDFGEGISFIQSLSQTS